MSDGASESFASVAASMESQSPISVTVRENVFQDSLDLVEQIWNFNLSTVDGSNITIGKVVAAILLILIGLVISKSISKLVVRMFLRRSMHAGAAHAIRSILFYILVASFSLGALSIVHIPLTIFTLLGGALAIGVGFGSQNLASNFISGVILLLEQPVRVGDVIEVDGIQGTVSHIGLRSTLVKTANNLDVVVPNNSLLDRKIINWTLSDSLIRRSVSMGIAYASDVKKVEQLVLTVVDGMPEILKYPAASFFVLNFGPSSLECEIRFWMSVRSIGECLRVESELRVAILAEFTKHGVNIPFPQLELRKAPENLP